MPSKLTRLLMSGPLREGVRQAAKAPVARDNAAPTAVINSQPASLTPASQAAIPDVILNGSSKELDFFLGFFLWECPSSMIPTREDVRMWAEALEQRGPEFFRDAAACREYVDGPTSEAID